MCVYIWSRGSTLFSFNCHTHFCFRYVLRKISSLETDYWFPNVTAPRSATKYLEKYFGSIPKSLVDGVEEGYSLDFELFGFDKGLSSKLNKTS